MTPKQTKPSVFDVPITRLVSDHLIAVKRDTSIDALLTLFVEKGLSRVAVVDDAGEPIGIVSKTDLLMRAAVGEAKTVMQVMTRDVVSIPDDMSLPEASALMVRRRLHALVVRRKDRYGWISSTDVVRWVAARANGWKE